MTGPRKQNASSELRITRIGLSITIATVFLQLQLSSLSQFHCRLCKYGCFLLLRLLSRLMITVIHGVSLAAADLLLATSIAISTITRLVAARGVPGG